MDCSDQRNVGTSAHQQLTPTLQRKLCCTAVETGSFEKSVGACRMKCAVSDDAIRSCYAHPRREGPPSPLSARAPRGWPRGHSYHHDGRMDGAASRQDWGRRRASKDRADSLAQLNRRLSTGLKTRPRSVETPRASRNMSLRFRQKRIPWTLVDAFKTKPLGWALAKPPRLRRDGWRRMAVEYL